MAELTPLRRNKQFQLLWFGSAVSQLGTELTRLAMPLLVLALTGSPGWAGVVAGARTAAFIVTQMPAGILVDRWDRRRTLIASQGAQLVNAAVLALLIVTDGARIWHFVVLGVVDGICTAFSGPARTIAIRGVVPAEQLRGAYAQEEARSHAARLLGPPLGGLLYGIGRAVPFVLDVLTFLVAFLCSVFAKVPRRPATTNSAEEAAPRKRTMRREAAEAAAWLWRQRGLRGVCAAVMAMNLLGPAILIPLIVLVGQRGGGALTTGMVLAGIGIGGLVGALLSDRIGGLLPAGMLLISILAAFGVADLVMVLPLGSWWPMVPLLITAVFTPTLNVLLSVAVSRLVPHEMLGRLDAMLTVAVMGLSPLAPVLGGALAAGLGGAGAIVVLGVGFLLVAAAAATSRELRHFTEEAPAEVAGDAEPSKKD
ncbi:MFS transporter [Allokutzneria oryzae]|uniref:MFS transporter n=1 Tax=Allokutzneria oryzae TaxID=1378989 RepID=A0ABV5ZXH7_9PSEU